MWTDDGTITASDVIGFSEWQCNPGATVNAFSSTDQADTLDKVQYYLQRYNYNGAYALIGNGVTTGSTSFRFTHPLRTMRSDPTITSTAYTTFGGNDNGDDERTSSAVGFANIEINKFELIVTTSSANLGACRMYSKSSTCFVQADSRL